MYRIQTIADIHIPGYHSAYTKVAMEQGPVNTVQLPLYRCMETVIANRALGGIQLVATQANQVVGWCDIIPPVDVSEQSSGLRMGVLAEWRAKGIGSALLSQALMAARTAGVQRIEVCVAESNAAAQALFRKYGFVGQGERQPKSFGSRRLSLNQTGQNAQNIERMALVFPAH